MKTKTLNGKNQFEVNGWIKFGEEDVYQDGCDYNTGFTHSGNDIFRANTIQELIQECQDFCGSDSQDDLSLDSCDETGRLDISIMENVESYKASQRELNQWKEGKLKPYSCIYSFRLQIVTREDVSLTKPFVTK